MEHLKEIYLIDRDVYVEAGVKVSLPTRKVVACAVVSNPYANTKAATQEELDHLARISFDVGTQLVKRALAQFRDGEQPTAYGKASIVGTGGQREHSAAMIHLKVGLAMRQGLGAGPALIPGNEKQGGPGTVVDLVFGGTETGWEYDAFDSIEVSVPGSPKPDEIILAIGFAAGGRPNGRIQGVTAAMVADLLKKLPRKA